MSSVPQGEGTGRVSTFDDADKLGPYRLAQMWGEQSWPLRTGRTPADEVEELAVMASLRHWLTRWLPMQVNAAVKAGVSLSAIRQATGMTDAQLLEMWQEWSDGQLRLQAMVKTSEDRTAEFARVGAVLRGDPDV